MKRQPSLTALSILAALAATAWVATPWPAPRTAPSRSCV